jgi:SPP1 family predicted phage head-tail adaptor
MSLGRPKQFGVGSMRHRCTIQQVTETQDASGQPVVSWSDFVVDEPCQFIPTGGSETMRGRQLEAGTKAIFRVRFRSGYQPEMRIVFNSTNYGITYVNQIDGLRRYLELVCVT